MSSNKSGIPAIDEDGTLRGAAMWVVLHWDANRSQHGSMGDLREALGLPREPPTREEAERRINEYIGTEGRDDTGGPPGRRRDR